MVSVGDDICRKNVSGNQCRKGKIDKVGSDKWHQVKLDNGYIVWLHEDEFLSTREWLEAEYEKMQKQIESIEARKKELLDEIITLTLKGQ